MRNKLISLIGLLIGLIGLINLLTLTSCEREPVLHLYDSQTITTDIPVVDLDLKVIWDYQLTFDVEYDWQAEWYYGWDENDKVIYGELGYSQPTTFNLRRYYTGAVPYAPHTTVIAPPPSPALTIRTASNGASGMCWCGTRSRPSTVCRALSSTSRPPSTP